MYLFSMPHNEELSSKDETTNSTDNRTSSITNCLSMGPIAAASRLMSSLSRQSRSNTTIESIDNTEMSVASSLISKSTTKRTKPPRNRSISPKSPSSEPSISTNSSPLLMNSAAKMRNSSTTPSSLNSMSRSPRTSMISTTPTPETVDLNFNFSVTYTQLHDLAETNCNYFSQQKNDVCRRFERLLIQLSYSLELSVPMIRYLTENFHHFDYSPEVKQQKKAIGFVFSLYLFLLNRFVHMVIEH